MTKFTRKSGASGSSSSLGRVVFLGITAACFTFLYYRLNGAATREGLLLFEYMTQVFANVRWLPWLALMMAYSSFYFFVDTLVLTRVLNWFIRPIRYRDILPIRASAYILSIFNEQIGKGAMAFYLNKRGQVPGWQVASPAPQGFLGHLIARECSQEECRDEEARSGFGGGGGSPEGDRSGPPSVTGRGGFQPGVNA